MKKHFFCLAITLFALANIPLFSQSLFKLSEEEKVINSSLILEGKVTSQQSFWNEAHTMIYTSNKIEVYKVFKGSVTEKTVEIITVGGTVDDYTVTASDLLELSNNETGTFFCFTNSKNIKSPSSGRILYDVYGSAQGFYRYDLRTQTASAPFVRVDNITSHLYEDLKAQTGRDYENKKPSFSVSGISSNTQNRQMAPVISNFTPASVIAGAYALSAQNLLTINGSGFTTPTGAAGINFDNPDDGTGGTPTFVAATSDLIVSWNDAQIVVKVPSRVGTGTFSVLDNAGASVNSPTPLAVSYAILNGTFGASPINRQYSLMNLNGSGGYNYVYSNSALGGAVDFSTSAQEPAFTRAITTWKETTGLNFVFTGTTASQVVNAGDGTNIIMLDNTNTGQAVLPAGVLAVCYSSGSSCGGNLFVRRAGFDIVIRNTGVSAGSTNFNNGPCKTSTAITEVDMESVILHELGHALNLGHINDSYIGAWPNVDPGKLMNFAIVNGVDRRTPDNSAYTGALYNISPRGLAYGGCTAATEMIPVGITSESKDECPVTFPLVHTSNGTTVNFDLNHATSNKFGDPQLTRVNTTGVGTGITNNAYYAMKTGASGGTLNLTVSGYATVPVAQAACTGAGIELSLYQVSSCPVGQSFPVPVAYRTFNANGAITAITGLAANTNYLMMLDGISNTKANFSIQLNGTAVLPISLLSFGGTKEGQQSSLNWETAYEFNNDRWEIERSKDGINFYTIGTTSSKGNSTDNQSYTYLDKLPTKGTNYYRLKQYDVDGKITYSKIIYLSFEDGIRKALIYPNPVRENLFLDFSEPEYNPVLKIYTLEGKLIKQEFRNVLFRNESVNVEKLPSGTYLLQITTQTGVQNFKFVKN